MYSTPFNNLSKFKSPPTPPLFDERGGKIYFVNTSVNEIVFDKSTRTALEAANQIGCTVGQIAKSLIFVDDNQLPVIIIASGSNRVDENKFKLKKADAEFVKEQTGFVIGGVPPWGHKIKLKTVIDEDLKQYDKIWASSGKTNAVFELTFDELVKETGGEVRKIKSKF